MKKYQEIEKLKSIYKKNSIQIKPLKRANFEGFVLAEITIEKQSWKIYIDDEYGDCSKDKPLVAFYLMLFSLDVYDDSLDYLDWCNQNKINASDLKWLTYYKSLEKTYSELKHILGDLDPCIDSFDYQIRNGVIDALFASEV
ncbi:MAG: hypothetical protein COB12_12865 [Flavobacterium sp.]|nr:MAG: hypothetical protein COB12_12865 [Flavobacterium sp.]